jgi:hypothetical protein
LLSVGKYDTILFLEGVASKRTSAALAHERAQYNLNWVTPRCCRRAIVVIVAFRVVKRGARSGVTRTPLAAAALADRITPCLELWTPLATAESNGRAIHYERGERVEPPMKVWQHCFDSLCFPCAKRIHRCTDRNVRKNTEGTSAHCDDAEGNERSDGTRRGRRENWIHYAAAERVRERERNA